MEFDTLKLDFTDDNSEKRAQAHREFSPLELTSVEREQAREHKGVGPVPTIRPNAPRLIAEDPEKRRIVGRRTAPHEHRTPEAQSDDVEALPLEQPVASPQAPPPPPVFEGTGLKEVGTLRAGRQDDEDDEFSYALEGGRREEGFHKQVYRPKAMPAHLISNVKQRLNTEVLEEEEEEEEADNEDTETSEAEEDAGEDGTEGQDDDKQQEDDAPSRSRDKQPNSWTTFAVSEGHMESLADASNLAAEVDASPLGAQPAADPSHEDLPSYKLMQVLQGGLTPAATGVIAGSRVSSEQMTVEGTGPSSMTGRGLANSDTSATGQSGSKQHEDPLSTAATVGTQLPQTPGVALTSAADALSAAAAVAWSKDAEAAAKAAGGAVGPATVGEPEDEWATANLERHREMAAPTTTTSPGSPTLSYDVAMAHFMSTDVSSVRSAVLVAMPPPPGFFARLLCLAPPRLQPPVLREQLHQLLSLARVPFKDDDAMHVRLLGSIYGAFTGKSYEPPRYGSHWAELGFQGQDPATDLRGCGILGLLQLFHLTQWSVANANKMLRLSQHPVQEFPLAIVSINVTQWTLEALRSGHLHHDANNQRSVVEVAQAFHGGCMATFYTTWLRGRKTMMHSGHVLKELKALALKKPRAMVVAAKQLDLPYPPPTA